MDGMGQHNSTSQVAELAGKPLRRGRAWAWTVFVSMAGTSVLFNVYHDLVVGRMHPYLAVPAGVLPLLLAVGALEIAAAWPSASAKVIAWGVTLGAMGWSAAAMGGVVMGAAPPHMEMLFGFLADAAALLAVSFLLNGPAASHAVAEVAGKLRELTERANAERRAREEAEANAARSVRELRAAHEAEAGAARQANGQANEALSGQLAEANETARREAAGRRETEEKLAAVRTELAAVRAGRDAAEAARRSASTARDEEAAKAEHQVGNLRSQLDAARAAAARQRAVEAERDLARTEAADLRAELDAARTALGEAERAAADANARAERSARKLAAQAAPKTARGGRTETARGDRTEGALTPAQAREKAYEMLDENPDLTGAEVGEPFGFGDRWGQKRKEEYEHRNGLRAVGES
jgi:hypothetical protein